MSGKKYRYNTRTLSYERIELTFWGRVKKTLSYTLTGSVFAVFFIFMTYAFFDSPKEKSLKNELQEMKFQYEILNKRMVQAEDVLQDMQRRDDNIYRVVFEAEPIPENLRKAGFGGVNRYKHLSSLKEAELVTNTTKKLDQITKQIYIQSKSFDEVYEMANKKEDMLLSIPSIMPVANKNLLRMASGYGYRIHPIYKKRMMHTGQDFSAPTGTEIYATGNGKVIKVKKDRRGYGYHIIIDHGYGYQTLYGHMSAFNVRRGQMVKRGEVIGYVGNTGRSTAPHLHYEVIKNGSKINPVNFYYNDLSPEQYDEVIQISTASIQSFD